MIDIKINSKDVKEGDTFIAIKNFNNDGHNYINEAIKNGAKKIICERGLYDVKTVIVPDTKKYLKEYLYNNYYNDIKNLKLIGITGTNGKTTTSYLTYQLLNRIGENCAYIGTIGFYCNNIRKELNNTTPDIYTLYNLLLESKSNNIKTVIMEVSSHSLDLDRVYGLKFDEVAFTNLTLDHLDYHKTIDNYIDCKKKLFYKTRNNRVAIINSYDKYYKEFINNNNKNILIGKDLKIIDIKYNINNTNIIFEYNKKKYETSINLIGKYNVLNYLMSILLINNLGYNMKEIIDISSFLEAPPGRMEKINYNNNYIFIDYAHTPDAVYNVLNNINDIKSGKIITIIGCGGDRDKSKRPIMGNLAEIYSDYVIFTNDNPRCENEKKIMLDILFGVKKDNHEIIFDRSEAIKKGISMLNSNDILMILGKGHENYQIIGNKKFYFSDRNIVDEYIYNNNKKLILDNIVDKNI